MKKFKQLALKLLSMLAIATTVVNVNSSCPFYMYEPDEPEEAKKYKLW